MYTLNINSVYDFTFYASAILGSGLTNAKVTALLDFETAIGIADVPAIHAKVLPQLPSGTPSDPTKLIYVKLLTNQGATAVMAMDWISAQPVQSSVTTVSLDISLSSLSDQARLTAWLNAGGFNQFVYK